MTPDDLLMFASHDEKWARVYLERADECGEDSEGAALCREYADLFFRSARRTRMQALAFEHHVPGCPLRRAS